MGQNSDSVAQMKGEKVQRQAELVFRRVGQFQNMITYGEKKQRENLPGMFLAMSIYDQLDPNPQKLKQAMWAREEPMNL